MDEFQFSATLSKVGFTLRLFWLMGKGQEPTVDRHYQEQIHKVEHIFKHTKK
jgi:hypothetical protein